MNSLLAVDVGGGTQDILLYEPNKPLENCIQMVLPSPTLLVAQAVRRATAAAKPVYLYGRIMGGGPSTKAIKDHLSKGLSVYAAPEAALTLHDNPENVRKMGVVVTDHRPEDAVAIRTGDLDVPMLERMLAEVGQAMPGLIAVAVQDHGYSPHESNRIFRFRMWEQFMASGGALSDLSYTQVPAVFTRMQAVTAEAPGALVMDTCGAALLGALTDERVMAAAQRGVVAVINLGNQHTFAALVRQNRVLGLFEHHTAMMTVEKVRQFLTGLCAGKLTNTEIQEDNGHGCLPPQSPVTPELVVVTGPRRGLLASENYYFAAPQGNMMLMGCFGLVAAARADEDFR